MYSLFILGMFSFPDLITFLLVVILIYLIFKKKKSDNTVIESNFDNVVRTSREVVENNLIKVKKNAEQSISKSYMANYNWLLVNESFDNVIYTFRSNDELLITTNGIVERCNYELIVDNNSILITSNNITKHYNIVNKQNDFLIIQLLATDNFLIFANQTKYKDYLKSQLKEMVKNNINE
jgi:hypothetical protein